MSLLSNKAMAMGKIKVKSILNGFRSPGVIFLQDGKTKDKEVVCQEGILVKDILDRICSSLDITPAARLFFTLCNPKSCFPLNPYHRLTQEEAKKQYQLRVYINTRENSLQFQKLSPSAYAYYYEQLKEDFIADRLYPRATLNTALWMAAIDIAREAYVKGRSFSELIPRDISKFMSSFLSKKYSNDKRIQDKVSEVFHRFHTLEEPSEDHFKWKYVEVYEKDKMCGQHIFRIREGAGYNQKSQEMLLVVSLSDGIYKSSKEEDEGSRESVCLIKDVKSLKVDLTVVAVNIECDTGQGGQEQTIRLNFTDKKELVSFAVIVQGYHKLFVDANGLILTGDLEPPEECLVVGINDGRRQSLCHGPISPRSAEGILQAFGLEEGLFLVRESRNVDNAFTLSLCHGRKVLNFRIQRSPEGKFSFKDPPDQEEGNEHVEFPSLYHLIEQHKNKRDGLPTLLKRNLAPDVTNMVPLLPIVDDMSERTMSVSSRLSTPTSPVQHSEVVDQLIEEGVPFIKYSELKTSTELGSGNFSTVYLATWESEGVERKVAVKIPTMQSSTVEAVKRDLKREIKTMSSLCHPNVVNLLGISESPHYLSFIGMIPVVIMEFVEGGSLRGVLNDLIKKGLTPEVKAETKTKFLYYGIQIAEGMKYLEARKVVHRDLAARNVLLERDSQTIKISDFGLARQKIEDQDYYKGNLGSSDLPIYWYAPECLRSLKFDTKGDVWSYGVTLWEVFTYGETPTKQLSVYVRGLPAREAFTRLADVYRNNIRLKQGFNCYKSVYDIIMKCWKYEANERPTFDELVSELNELLRKIQASSTSSPTTRTPQPVSPQQQTTPTSPSSSSTMSISPPS